MKSRLRKPFRAPRAAVLRSHKRKVTDKLDVAEVQPLPDHLQSDSEEGTELRLVGLIVKESEPPEVRAPEREAVSVGQDNITKTGDEYEGKGEASVESSPNLSEFERYLDVMAKERRRPFVRGHAKRQCVSVATSPARQILLPMPEDEPNSRVVSIDDILPEVMEEDDDVPIVATLNLAKPKRKGGRKKSELKWTYETVAEPTGTTSFLHLLHDPYLFQHLHYSTGVASKYWDEEATSERATKKRAKEKLAALNTDEETATGSAIEHTKLSKFRIHYFLNDSRSND